MLKWLRDKYHKKRWDMLNDILRKESMSGNKLLIDMYLHWPYIKDVNYDVDEENGIFAKVILKGGDVIKGCGTYAEAKVLDAGEKYLEWLADKWDIKKGDSNDEG